MRQLSLAEALAYPTGAGDLDAGRHRVVTDYEIVIHFREPTEPIRIPLAGVAAEVAETDRQTLKHDIEQARLAEAPEVALRTASGQPAEPVTVDPHDVTEVDLIELPDGD
jgi:hypothetical protein